MSKECARCTRRLAKKQFVWADRYGNEKDHRHCKYCKLVREKWRLKNFTYTMISNSRYKDSGKRVGEGRKPKDFTWNEKDYITRKYIDILRDFQEDRCAYCNILMQTINRNLPDGMTLEALDSTKPHVRSNCCLACKRCNTSRIGQKNMSVREAVVFKHLAAGLENFYQQSSTEGAVPSQSGSMSDASSSEDRNHVRRMSRRNRDTRSASYV